MGCLSYGRPLNNEPCSSATLHRQIGRPSFGGQRTAPALPRSTNIRQNLWKSNQGSGHAKVKHQRTQPGCCGLNALSCAHQPNWSFNSDANTGQGQYWCPPRFALRRRLTLALGPSNFKGAHHEKANHCTIPSLPLFCQLPIWRRTKRLHEWHPCRPHIGLWLARFARCCKQTIGRVHSCVSAPRKSTLGHANVLL